LHVLFKNISPLFKKYNFTDLDFFEVVDNPNKKNKLSRIIRGIKDHDDKNTLNKAIAFYNEISRIRNKYKDNNFEWGEIEDILIRRLEKQKGVKRKNFERAGLWVNEIEELQNN